MTAPLDEARLRKLAEAATPGEWGVEVGMATLWVGPLKDNSIPKVGNIVVSMDYGRGYKPSFYEQQKANAAFIATARTAIPQLLNALSAERERGHRAVGLLDRWMVAEHPIIATQVKRDTRAFLATQKAEGA